MAKIFVSYNRQDASIAHSLVTDLDALGHEPWVDKELSGGQRWWDQILQTIRKCDIFVFVLGPESLNSVACKREYSYAASLGKPVLPVLISDQVSTHLLPTALSQIQFVEYLNADREAAFRLARALNKVPPPKPLPDPLPDPPDVPVSYLGSLIDVIDGPNPLTFEKQSSLVFDLKRVAKEDPESRKDVVVLLRKIRKRRELTAIVAEEIDELVRRYQKIQPEWAKAEKPESKDPKTAQSLVDTDTATQPSAPVKEKASHSKEPPSEKTDTPYLIPDPGDTSPEESSEKISFALKERWPGMLYFGIVALYLIGFIAFLSYSRPVSTMNYLMDYGKLPMLFCTLLAGLVAGLIAGDDPTARRWFYWGLGIAVILNLLSFTFLGL